MSKTTKIIISIIIAIVVIGGIWYGLTRKPVSNEPIKIGAILPLTGDFATYGEGMKNAIDLAIENSGLKDRIQLIIEDDKGCAVTEDVSIAQKLININKTKEIIGSTCSSAFLSVLPITEQSKIILITPAATSKSITGAGNYIFRTCASDAAKSIAVAKFAYNKNYRKAALLYDIGNDAFIQQRDDVRGEFTGLGGQISIEESFKSGDTDFRSQLTKIKNSNIDVVFIGTFPKEGGLILKQARELKISLPFISSETDVGVKDVIDIAGEAAEGLIFPFATTPTNKEYTDFVNLYNNKFGKQPPAYASESYDATMLLIKAVVESDGTSESIKDELQKIGQNYYGASGIITFDKNGDVQKPMIIKTIKNGQFVPYEINN